MLDQLVSLVAQFYSKDEKRGVFLTGLNGTAIVGSNGVMSSTYSWPEVVAKLYKAMSTSPTPILTLVCDIVTNVEEVTDYTVLKQLSHDDCGLILCTSDGVQLGALLPKTAGIQNLSQGLTYMKQKYQLQGMVNVYIIKTDRKVISAGG